MSSRKKCGTCLHVICDVIGRNRPEKNIEFVCESIVLFERVFGSEFKEETREVALEAISKYGPATPFENDERMLPVYRILGKYSRSMSSTDIYDKLYEKGLFLSSPKFYFDWIDVHLQANKMERAIQILSLMENTVGSSNELYVSLLKRIAATQQKPSRIAALVKPTAEVNSHPARRSLFGRASPIETSPANRTKNSQKHTTSTSQVDSSPCLPSQSQRAHVSNDSIVLPHIVDAPPIDMSIVSPSMSLHQSGQLSSNFTLPPVFTFSNTTCTSLSQRPTMSAVIEESNSSFTVPTLPQNAYVTRNLKENTENCNPNYEESTFVPTSRRNLAGVLQPSQGVKLDKYEELEKEAVPEKKLLTGYELKKSRLHNQQINNSVAARRIFADPAIELESAFKSLGIASPSLSNN